MVYSASLNFAVKKALKTKAVQSTIKKICDQLPLDPDTTNMDIVILGPKDASAGPRAETLKKAIAHAHSDICIIYIYDKDNLADLIDTPYKRKVKRISPPEISRAFEDFVGEHKIKSGKQQLTSADFDVQKDDTLESKSKLKDVKFEGLDASGVELEETPQWDGGGSGKKDSPDGEEAPISNQAPLPEPLPLEMPEPEPLPEVPLDTSYQESEQVPLQTPEPQEIPPSPLPLEPGPEPQPEPQVPTPPPAPSPMPTPQVSEEFLAGIHSFGDWEIMKEHLTRDSVTRSLINENSEYVGLINMLDVLDNRIRATWLDNTLTADQKFERIKDIGLERSVVQASRNSLNVEKVISIITTIILAAERTVKEHVQNIDVALYKVTSDKQKIMDTGYIDQAIQERSKVQIELLNIARSIVDMYKSIDGLVYAEIRELDAQLPSKNEFINNMMKPIGTQIFTPANTALLVNKLLKCLQDNQIIASQMEDTVNTLIDKLFTLCEKDEEIIQYEKSQIQLLEANRVEEVVIADTLIKQCMYVYVGADNTGRTATALTWSGILSRRHNTLLLDLTGKNKFALYGVDSVDLTEFMNNRIQEPFLCVASKTQLSPDQIQDFIREVSTRLNYYAYINVIVDSDDRIALAMLAEESKVVHYITNCSTSSIEAMHSAMAQPITANIAKKLVCIDTPVSPMIIANQIGADYTSVQLISLPAIPAIRACAIRHDSPFEYSDIVKIFEEAFR